MSAGVTHPGPDEGYANGLAAAPRGRADAGLLERRISHPAHGNLCLPDRDRIGDAGARGRNSRHLRPHDLDLSGDQRPAGSPVQVRRAMSSTASTSRVARRAFLHGRWGDDPARDAAFEIASILVQARPERLDEVAAAIAALPGTQVYSRDAR